MGAKNTKALMAVNRLYPLEDGDLETIPGVDPEELEREEEAFEDYEDEDEAIDQYMDEVWSYYDKKEEKVINKKAAQQFFKDALQIFALRKGKKPKDILDQAGVKEKAALESAFSNLSADGKTLTYDKFKEFINMADLHDVMKLLTGQQI